MKRKSLKNNPHQKREVFKIVWQKKKSEWKWVYFEYTGKNFFVKKCFKSKSFEEKKNEKRGVKKTISVVAVIMKIQFVNSKKKSTKYQAFCYKSSPLHHFKLVFISYS